MTHDEIKAIVESAAKVRSPAHVGSRTRLLLQDGPAFGASLVSAAKAKAWAQYMHDAVTQPGCELPDDVDTSPVQLDDARSMYSSIGGGVILDGSERARCTSRPYRVAASVTGPDWVAVSIDGELVAMSIPDAFRRGLREVALPKD